jgi:hypothetical protein
MLDTALPTTFRAWLAAVYRRARFWLDIVTVVRLNGWIMLSLTVVSIILFARSDTHSATFFDRRLFYTTLALVLGIVLLFYVMVIVVPYLWFLFGYYVIRKDRNQILFKFPGESCVFGESFVVDAIIQRKLRLMFGVIKFRLVFFNYDMTDWYFLLQSQKRKGELFNSADRGAIGSFSITFRHLGRFRTRYSVVKFEDPFGFFSLPIIEKEYHPIIRERNFHIYSIPSLPSAGAAPYYVKKTNIPAVSEQKFRVAEDFFDSKRYEPTDDSRRIMWKVYARSRDLLVRIIDKDSVIDADVDLCIMFNHSMYTIDSEAFHRLYDRYVRDIAVFLELLTHQRALTIHLRTDCDEYTGYEYDRNLTHDENVKRHLVSAYWHRLVPPRLFVERVLEERSHDRERILIVHPGVRPADIPTELLGRFSSCFMLGDLQVSVLPGKGVKVHPLYTSRRGTLAAALTHIELAWLHRKLESNKRLLKPYFIEGFERGHN